MTLITYYTQTGNTQQIAEAIYEALGGKKEIKPVDEVTDVKNYSLIFVGFPVHSHSVPYKMETFLKQLPSRKKIALFSTHGSLTGSRLSREALEHATVLASKAKILGTFSCQGKVSPEALEILSKSPEHKAWTEMAASARRHPDEKDRKSAQNFARWVLTLSSQK